MWAEGTNAPFYPPQINMSHCHSLNSLKGGYIGDYIGSIIGVLKGDTRSLDYSSHVAAYSPFLAQRTLFGVPCLGQGKLQFAWALLRFFRRSLPKP